MSTLVKTIIGLIVVIAIGIGVWLVSPLFYDKRVSEELPPEFASTPPVTTQPATQNQPSGSGATPTPTQTATEPTAPASRQGTFSGFDATHQGSGTAQILSANEKAFVRFEDNFQVTNGPDLYVYLGNNGRYDADTNLGRLKGNIGSQNYEIPAGIDPAQYSEVWVWCRAFSVPFAKAVLQ